MAIKSRAVVYTVKIRAPSDPSGNPRRGWMVYSKHSGHYFGFVDEGYSGRGRLKKLFPNYRELASIPVAYSVYKDCMGDEL